jgi:hypothetical protein
MLSCLVAAACGHGSPTCAPATNALQATPTAPAPSTGPRVAPPAQNATERSPPPESDRTPIDRTQPHPAPTVPPAEAPSANESRSILRERPPAPLPPQPAPFTPTMPAPEPL